MGARPYGRMLGWAVRLPIAGDHAPSQKLVELGMRPHHFLAGRRQRMCGILDPHAAVRVRQSAGNIAHNCDQFLRRGVSPRRGSHDFPLQSRANFPIRLQLSNLALGLARAIFTYGYAIDGELSFRLTKRAKCHGDF